MSSTTIYCVYLTTYLGNKLPPFYIGSTSVIKVDLGYHGSVTSKKYSSIWKSELQQNPQLFKTKIITTCETRAQAFIMEERLQRALNVVQSPMYINESVANKGFDNSGKVATEETKSKLSKVRLGREPWNKGKKCPQISNALKGKDTWNKGSKGLFHLSSETRRKMSITRTGKSRPAEVGIKVSLAQKGVPKGPISKCSCLVCKNVVAINRLFRHRCCSSV